MTIWERKTKTQRDLEAVADAWIARGESRKQRKHKKHRRRTDMAEGGGNGARVTPGNSNEIGALWEARDKNGGLYYKGRINGISVNVFKNNRKSSENSPDWRILKCLPADQRVKPAEWSPSGQFTVTEEWLRSHSTKDGGYTAVQLSLVEVAWPPQRDWMQRATGRTISDYQRRVFEAIGAGQPQPPEENHDAA
jgi:hypothetical protein